MTSGGGPELGGRRCAAPPGRVSEAQASLALGLLGKCPEGQRQDAEGRRVGEACWCVVFIYEGQNSTQTAAWNRQFVGQFRHSWFEPASGHCLCGSGAARGSAWLLLPVQRPCGQTVSGQLGPACAWR